MGLFSKRKCDICGKEIGIMGVISLVEGIACKECFSKSGMNRLNGLPHINEVRDRINGKKILKTYTATHKIDNVIMLNVEDKTWTAFPFAKIYKFKDLIDYEIIENGSTVSSKGIGRAIAGGLLFGGVGAIIGGVTAKSKTKNILNGLFLKIVINDFDNPNLMIDLLTVKKPITNPIGIQTVMKHTQDILSLLDLIRNNQIEDKNTIKTQSVADEILKFKDLMDKGIITKEEFEIKKKQLLEL